MITRNLLGVLLRTPLRTGFLHAPQAENLIFPFYLTQPLPHAGISSATALIMVFRLPGNYQSSVKLSRQCESTWDEGGPQSAQPHTSIQRRVGASSPGLPVPLADLGLPSRVCPRC